MRWLYLAAGLLWIVLAALLFALVSALFDTWADGKQQFLALAILTALATPVGLLLQSTHRRIREMTANRIVLRAEGIEVQLSGRAREWKGLPDVAQTLIPWHDVISTASEKKRFVYPSPIPIGYPLEVFTVYSKTSGISFTRECVPNAKKIASDISARIAG